MSRRKTSVEQSSLLEARVNTAPCVPMTTRGNIKTMSDQNEKLSDATHEADRQDAQAEHTADRFSEFKKQK